MSDLDTIAIQDMAHDLCEVNCGKIRQGVKCPVRVSFICKGLCKDVFDTRKELAEHYCFVAGRIRR